MYRLAEHKYPTLRRLVTNELIGGFEKIFGSVQSKKCYVRSDIFVVTKCHF